MVASAEGSGMKASATWASLPGTRKSWSSICRISLALLTLAAGTAVASVNVYFSGSQGNLLQQQFLASTTAQWQAQLVPNPYYSNTYTLTLTGPNTGYQVPVVTPSFVQLDTTTFVRLLTQNATNSYIFGFADGQTYGRAVDLGILAGFEVQCSSASLFGASTSTWSQLPCVLSLTAAATGINQQNVATPTVIPGF